MGLMGAPQALLSRLWFWACQPTAEDLSATALPILDSTPRLASRFLGALSRENPDFSATMRYTTMNTVLFRFQIE